MTELSKIHNSPESAARLKKRRAAEWRLKAYGILAIVLAGAALITLMWSVVSKASGAFTESYISLPVYLEADEIDPDNTGDPTIIGRANYGGLSKDALKAAFPFVKSRGDKREMYDIISGGAAFELRELAMTTPSVVGQTLDFRFLASDIADLYLKGSYGELIEQNAGGNLTVESSGKTAVVNSSAADFAFVMARLKEDLRGKAAFNRDQAALQENGRAVFVERGDLVEAAKREAERDRLIALAIELEARAAQDGGTEVLDKSSPSVLVRMGETWVKLTAVSATGGEGDVIGTLRNVKLATGDWQVYSQDLPEASRKVSDLQIVLIENLRSAGVVETVFNTRFFTAGDSREPELAGIWGAAVGSFWTMLVTILLAFPIGVMAAVYLEEFAKKNLMNTFIEVNINNLAAVPSIVYGLLGLAVFLGFFGVPRSAPLAGGIVLAVMTLPTIIIASRAAMAAVPPSIRDAALGIGASKLQTAFHHVLPLSMPGILTGTIIGMARALGETAPLIMIGMVAFIVDVPTGITDSATVLPVQIYRWSDFPERAFEARTSAAILVLLVFLVLMNGLAVFLRKRFERRW
ncbi:phosphate ABC transporter, permease protein PstA [Rhodobacterales bacterium 52_120_T64]|nr:phosphate ABC transporter, permease protein PstA [Rhodobacterales bacterium 52_120_T64]